MFTTWDLVRPTLWHPMSMLEQSVMELDYLTRAMSEDDDEPVLEIVFESAPSESDDDDFFIDLPIGARGMTSSKTARQPTRRSQRQQQSKHEARHLKSVTESSELERSGERAADKAVYKSGKEDTRRAATATGEAKDTVVHTDNDAAATHEASREHAPVARPYSSYSFSTSSVVDDHGRRVTSMRRRYEDSKGRLKAVHKREVGDQQVTTTWRRKSHEDTGVHQTTCVRTTPDAFDALWHETPFGQAEAAKQRKKHEKMLKQKMKAGETTEPQSDEQKDTTGATQDDTTPAARAANQSAATSGSTNEQCATGCDCSDCRAKQQCPPHCDCLECRAAKEEESTVERELRDVEP